MLLFFYKPTEFPFFKFLFLSNCHLAVGKQIFWVRWRNGILVKGLKLLSSSISRQSSCFFWCLWKFWRFGGWFGVKGEKTSAENFQNLSNCSEPFQVWKFEQPQISVKLSMFQRQKETSCTWAFIHHWKSLLVLEVWVQFPSCVWIQNISALRNLFRGHLWKCQFDKKITLFDTSQKNNPGNSHLKPPWRQTYVWSRVSLSCCKEWSKCVRNEKRSFKTPEEQMCAHTDCGCLSCYPGPASRIFDATSIFRPSATKSGRPYGVTSASSWSSCRTSHTGWSPSRLSPPLG